MYHIIIVRFTPSCTSHPEAMWPLHVFDGSAPAPPGSDLTSSAGTAASAADASASAATNARRAGIVKGAVSKSGAWLRNAAPLGPVLANVAENDKF